MRIHAAPLLAPGRILVLDGDAVVIDGRLADLIPDDGEDGYNFDVFLNPTDVAGFMVRWCKQTRRLN